MCENIKHIITVHNINSTKQNVNVTTYDNLIIDFQ